MDRKSLMTLLFQQIDSLNSGEERVPGYHEAITETLAGVMEAERRFQMAHTQVVVEVRGKCESLGDFLLHNEWKP